MSQELDIGNTEIGSDLRDTTDRRADPWRTSIYIFATVCLLGVLVTIGLLAALDPYDSGRFALWPAWQGRVDGDKWSRARDPRFDSAIIGDSRSEMVRPALLDEKTGLKFVSLSLRAAEPIEEFVILRSFIRRHPNIRAIVIGLNEQWCFNPLQSEYQKHHWFFPAWLYGGNAVEYLLHLYSFRTVKDLLAIKYAIPMRADGFEDYEEAFHIMKADTPEALQRKLALITRPFGSYNTQDSFPAALELNDVLAALPPSAMVVLAWVPSHIINIPLPGSPAEQSLAKCHAAFAPLAAARPHTKIINWAVDRPENRIDGNYFDPVHYRTPMAEAFGLDIAAALNSTLPRQ